MVDWSVLYEFREDGRIFRRDSRRELRGCYSNGFDRVRLTDQEGKSRLCYRHRLIWEQFNGLIEPGFVVSKIDMVSGCGLANLKLVKKKSGRSRKLTPEQVVEIKLLAEQGLEVRYLAERYLVSRATITRVLVAGEG
jgi:hypothetical protein